MIEWDDTRTLGDRLAAAEGNPLLEWLVLIRERVRQLNETSERQRQELARLEAAMGRTDGER